MTPNEMRIQYQKRINEILAPLGDARNSNGTRYADRLIDDAPDGMNAIKMWEGGAYGEKFVISKHAEIYALLERRVNSKVAELKKEGKL